MRYRKLNELVSNYPSDELKNACRYFCVFDGSFPDFDADPQKGKAIIPPRIGFRSSEPRYGIDGLEAQVNSKLSQIFIAFGDKLEKDLALVTTQEWKEEYADIIYECVRQLSVRGIAISTATKILHYHYRKMFPIMDSMAVQPRYWTPSSNKEKEARNCVLAIDEIRMAMGTESVEALLNTCQGDLKKTGITGRTYRLESFSDENNQAESDPLFLSDLRIVDILFWYDFHLSQMS